MIEGASIKKIPHPGIWDSLVRNDLLRDFSGREQEMFVTEDCNLRSTLDSHLEITFRTPSNPAASIRAAESVQ